MATQEERKPLFELDLGKNGGVWAPYTPQDVLDWVTREREFWVWTQSAPGYNHRSVIDLAVSQLNQAAAAAQRFVQGIDPQNMLGQVQAHVRTALVEMQLPQRLTTAAKEVEQMRQDSPERGIAYLFAQMPNPNNYRFESNSAPAWHAYVLGLFSAYGGLPGIDRVNAQRAALDELLADGRTLLASRRDEYDTLHNSLKFAVADGQEQSAVQANHFEAFMAGAKTEHSTLLDEHKSRMEALEKTYRADMTLRAPVDYWQDRHVSHTGRTTALLKAFGGMLLLVLILVFVAAAWAFYTSVSAKGQPPDAWRLAVVAFVAAVGVWLLRVLLRLFLSNLHLATDAAERVTMVKTYLALMEDEKLPEEDDRKLILQALFRPTSDGIVKDDGIPSPALDLLTRPR